ncbi:MAG: polysaccharide biosynthesis tyrosine autokinase [Bacteroidales bacterium]|nr:polysaccharide biosynthesis tyrosine autokinase [Bacteroidales bacterium]
MKDDDFKQSINYKKVVQRFLNFKKLYIISVILLLGLAYLYNRTATVLFSNSTTILITEKDNNPLAASKDFMSGMAFLSGNNNIDNEIEILKSFTILKETVQRMDLKTTIHSYERSIISKILGNTRFEKTNLIKKHEEYEYSPIRIVVNPTKDQITDLSYYVEFIDDNSFRIHTKDPNKPVFRFNYIDDKVAGSEPYTPLNGIFNFGSTINEDKYDFQILKTEYFDKSFTSNKVLYFELHNTNQLTFEYQSSLAVEQTSQTSSIIKLSLRGTNYYRVTDFLNNLAQVFLERNLEKKNNAAASTVSFIDAQITQFKDSVARNEAEVDEFRTSKGLMDLSFQGQQIFSKLEDLETEKATLEEQRTIYVNLRDYLIRIKNDPRVNAPPARDITDPLLISRLRAFTDKALELATAPEMGDYRKKLESNVENDRAQILELVNNSLSNINESLDRLQYRIQRLGNQISTMPKTELKLKGIERKFELNNAIYTFLLQKRAEAQITKASSMPDYEVVEPARALAEYPVSPRKKLNLLLALFLAFLLPTLFILIEDFFNNRLSDMDEIEAMAGKPILGKIFRSFRKTSLVVAQRPKSSVSESFRSVRTNFQFFDHSGKKQVVLLTSSASGDGKTFCSINFASVLALNGHRTVLLEFDLRRPKVHQEFGASNMIGISSFLIDKAVIEDIILPTEVENLDLISAGPAAPNPAELIASERTGEFLETLKEMYDYIVIDSAPVGIVSETFLLMKHSDVNIFVVRLDYTIRDAFRNALKGLANNGFNNFNLLLNDLNIRKASYKYGYDTKYYTEENHGFLRRLFKRKKKD